MPLSIESYERKIWDLNTHIALIRFSFRHLSQNPSVKAEFLAERQEQIVTGWYEFTKTNPEQFAGMGDTLAPIFAGKECDWMKANLQAVIEFSEHRLNQMELVMRYAFFESMVMDIVGNILWEYPDLIENTLHKQLGPKKLEPDESPQDFRARRTEKLVDIVDKMPYKQTQKNKTAASPTVCLCEYFEKGLDLQFNQRRYAEILEEIRTARNTIAHRASVSPKILTDDFMAKSQFVLSEFPRQLFGVALTEYPDACSEHSSPAETERPGYIIYNILKKL